MNPIARAAKLGEVELDMAMVKMKKKLPKNSHRAFFPLIMMRGLYSGE